MNNDPNLVNQNEPHIISDPFENTNPEKIPMENANPEMVPIENTNPVMNDNTVPEMTPVSQTQGVSEHTEFLEPITEPEVSTTPSTIRYNAVTGEEMDLEELKKGNDGKVQKPEAEYKPPSTFSTIVLILFFIGMLAFIIYLPDIVLMVEDYNNKRKGTGEDVKEEIPTGKLVCTLDTNTVNLDRTI